VREMLPAAWGPTVLPKASKSYLLNSRQSEVAPEASKSYLLNSRQSGVQKWAHNGSEGSFFISRQSGVQQYSQKLPKVTL
jgi:hypothetical protein